MASSRASTPKGRKRATKRASTTRPGSRPRSGGAHKPSKPKAKPRAAKTARSPAKASGAKPLKPKATKSKPVKSKPARAKAAKAKPARPRAATAKAAKPRARTLALIAGLLALGLVAAYFMWFRDSSFVAVEQVAVEGIEGPEAAQVTAALTESAQGMTTLNLDEDELAGAVSGFPTVVAIQAKTDFPHGLTVEVTDRPPVLLVSDGGPVVPVAGDGTILRGVTAPEGRLPDIQVDALPVKGKLEGEPLSLAKAVGAAPDPLLPMIEGVVVVPGEGIEVTLKGEIPVKFGDPDALEEKWTAVAAVLANPQVKTLTHLDVRVPERPSIGGAAPAPKATDTSETP